MKFSRMASLVCLLCLFPLSVPVQAADSLKISSTIGPVDAGILPLLADTFSKKTGIAISMEKAGISILSRTPALPCANPS